MDLADIPLDAVLQIFHFLGQPHHFLAISEICSRWYNIFSKTDTLIWRRLSTYYRVPMHFPVDPSRHLRSKSDFKAQFWISYQKKRRWIRESHENLLLQAKLMLEKKRDPVKQLQKLITKTFLDIADFDVNWRGSLIEDNTLLTIAARYCHIKSMMLLVETFGADINTYDMGGFSALVTLAYHGNIAGVKYCVKKGADLYQIGRLRSGAPLSAEHWASVKGHQEVFLYLRAMRQRLERGKSIAGHTTWKMILKDAANNSSTATATSSSFPVSNSEDQIMDRGDTENHESTAAEHFCICLRGFEGEMIACDSPTCIVEWYHFACVGLFSEPIGEWLCPRCRGEIFIEPVLAKSNETRSPVKNKRRNNRKQPKQSSEIIDNNLNLSEENDVGELEAMGETSNYP